MRSFAYRCPRSMPELFDLLDEHGPDAALLAGGTDLVVGLRTGKRTARVLIDLKRVDALRSRPAQVGEYLEVSATTTMTTLVEDPRVRRRLPALVESATIVGSVQIRNRATLVGNVCNASPAGDTLPALLVHRAELDLLSRAGRRRVPLDAFLLGPGRTDLRPGEVVTAVRIRLPGPRTGTSFARVTRRRGVDLATVSLCCAVDDRVTRFALGAVGPRTFVVQDDSGLLADPLADPERRQCALDEIIAAATPISDVRAGADYRRAMLAIHSRRALAAAIARRDEEEPDG